MNIGQVIASEKPKDATNDVTERANLSSVIAD